MPKYSDERMGGARLEGTIENDAQRPSVCKI